MSYQPNPPDQCREIVHGIPVYIIVRSCPTGFFQASPQWFSDPLGLMQMAIFPTVFFPSVASIIVLPAIGHGTGGHDCILPEFAASTQKRISAAQSDVITFYLLISQRRFVRLRMRALFPWARELDRDGTVATY